MIFFFAYFADDTFTKIFHLKDEIGIYIFFDDRDGKVPKLFIEKLIDNVLCDVFPFSYIILNADGLYTLDTSLFGSDAIKINESKFVVILTIKDTYDLLLCLFDFYNNDSSLRIRYYLLQLSTININISVSLRTFIFRGNFGLAFYDSYSRYPRFIFFNYPTIISTNKKKSDIIEINLFTTSPESYSFNIEENFEIINNIYGGTEKIKIINYISQLQTGIIIKSSKLNAEIQTNQIIDLDDALIFEQSTEGAIPGNHILELAPITYITEDDDNAILIKYYGNAQTSDFDEVQYFLEENFKLIYKVECYEKCKTCSQLGTETFYYCVKCSNEIMDVVNNGEKCICNKYKYVNSLDDNICFENCATNEFSYIKSSNEKYCLNSCLYNDEPLYQDESYNICYKDCSDAQNGNNKLFDGKCVRNCPINYIEENNICVLEDIKTDIIESTNYITTEQLKNEVIGTTNYITSENININDCLIDVDLLIQNYLEKNSTLEIYNYEECSVIYYCYSSRTDLDTLTEINPNLTFINIQECEKKLISQNELPPNSKLLVVGKQSPTDSSFSLISDFEYQIHFNNGTKLEHLSLCNQTKIEMSSPINEYLSEEQYQNAVFLSDQGYDIFNISSDFYYDICTSAYINGSDLSLSVRINDIMPDNISFCLDGCAYKGVNLNTKRFICSCSFDYENSDESNLMSTLENVEENFFIYIRNLINYEVTRCYHLTLDKNNYYYNFGFYFGAVILFLILILSFFYCFIGSNSIKIKFLRNEPNPVIIENKLNNTINLNKTNKKSNSLRIKDNNNINTIKKIKKQNQRSKTLRQNQNDRKINLMTIKKKTTQNIQRNINKKGSKKAPNIIMTNKYNINNFNISLDQLKNSFNKESKISHTKVNNNIDDNDSVKTKRFNELTYDEAITSDNRTFFITFLSFFQEKLEIIQIFFHPRLFSHITLTFSLYIFELLLDLTVNSLLFSDDVISQKYYNNGELFFFTSNILSLSSNVIVCFITFLIGKLINYYDALERAIIETNKKKIFYIIFIKLYFCIKINIIFFYIIIFFLGICCTYYLFIFCAIYKRIQKDLFENYIIGSMWSLGFTVATCLFGTIFRKVALSKKYKRLYLISRFIDEKF